MLTITIHILLALILFFIINWIGKHSYSIGYISLDVFARADEAPAFNFIFRVFTPVAYLFLTAAILYTFELDHFVRNFYLVSVYYLVIRLVVNLIMERGELMNWVRQFVYWFFIIFFSYFAYTKVIVTKKNLLPDFSNLSNELWFVILIFIYQVFNKIEFSNKRTELRKSTYIRGKLQKYQQQYGVIIDKQVTNEVLKGLIYSILIIENFNRPKVLRWCEYIRFWWTKKPHTLGVMQVRSDKMISDEESVVLGVSKIMNCYQKNLAAFENGEKEDYYNEWDIRSELIIDYNGGDSYYQQVDEMWRVVLDELFPNTGDRLLPKSTSNESAL